MYIYVKHRDNTLGFFVGNLKNELYPQTSHQHDLYYMNLINEVSVKLNLFVKDFVYIRFVFIKK